MHPDDDGVSRPVDAATPGHAGETGGGGLFRAVLNALAGFVIAGAVIGFVWSQIAQPSAFTVDSGQAFMGEAEAGRQFGVAVAYTWLGAITALVLGFVLGLRLHRHGWAIALIAAAAASVAAVIAWRVGLALGPPDPKSVIAAASDGERVPRRLEIDSYGILLVWPVLALAGLLSAIAWFVPEPPAPEEGVEPAGPASDESYGDEPRNH